MLFPPGTGKTLLAKAVAGEAGVPFFSVAASEFVEMFVGVGASRVRDLFDKAKAKAPCIVFIDELDAVGRQRGVGIGGGSDEREQTINQLLSEMDGFQPNAGVIVLAATNRPDVLDKALTRPGRFDRRITVDLPDLNGRTAILRIYAAKKPLGPDVDLSRIARRTPGFSGADLANLLNEAAIMAARRVSLQISAADVSSALEKIAMGPEKAGALTTPEKKRLVAYHEAGHAIVGALMPDYDRIEKISIVPRGQAGGVTMFVPDEDRLSAGFYSRTFLLGQLSVALGGRAAEELAFGADAVTTGAASDLQAVTKTARLMVEVAGLSRRFTHASLRGPDGDISIETADEAAREVAAVVQEAYSRALQLLKENRRALDRVAERLIEREAMDGGELDGILAAEGARMCPALRVAADPPPAPAGSGGDGNSSTVAR
jgi:cell division protease FtsH